MIDSIAVRTQRFMKNHAEPTPYVDVDDLGDRKVFEVGISQDGDTGPQMSLSLELTDAKLLSVALADAIAYAEGVVVTRRAA